MEKDDLTVERDTLLKSGSEFSETTPISRKAVLEDIALSRYAHLEIGRPDVETRRFELGEGETLIGRGSQCQVRLQFNNTSRLHARIGFREEEYFIEDLESTNGTFVNGVRIQKCILRNNDQIQIGDAKILFIEGRIRKKP